MADRVTSRDIAITPPVGGRAPPLGFGAEHPPWDASTPAGAAPSPGRRMCSAGIESPVRDVRLRQDPHPEAPRDAGRRSANWSRSDLRSRQTSGACPAAFGESRGVSRRQAPGMLGLKLILLA